MRSAERADLGGRVAPCRHCCPQNGGMSTPGRAVADRRCGEVSPRARRGRPSSPASEAASESTSIVVGRASNWSTFTEQSRPSCAVSCTVAPEAEDADDGALVVQPADVASAISSAGGRSSSTWARTGAGTWSPGT